MSRPPSSQRLRPEDIRNRVRGEFEYHDGVLELARVVLTRSPARMVLVTSVSSRTGQAYLGSAPYDDKTFALSIAGFLYNQALFREGLKGTKELIDQLEAEIIARVAMEEAGV